MLEIFAEHFINAGILFRDVTAILTNVIDPNEYIHHDDIIPTLNKLYELQWLCTTLELSVTQYQLHDMIMTYEAVRDGGSLAFLDPAERSRAFRSMLGEEVEAMVDVQPVRMKWSQLGDEVRSLSRCFGAELRTIKFMSLSLEDSRLYLKNAPMDISAFPSAQYDIQESARCLALGRETATVLHLMRVLEIGLAALAARFRVSFDHRNWENIIGDIEKEIKNISTGQSKPSDWKTQEQLFADVAKEFRYLKNAWRNHAMHAREKYTSSEAKGIFQHVSGLMKALEEAGIKE